MEAGEKYLSVVLLNSIKVAAFKNKDKKAGDKQPDYKGNGVAIWINEKKLDKPKEEEII